MIGAGRGGARDGEALHALLRDDSPESLCARAVPHVRAGLDRGETVIAVVSAEVQRVLRPALGDDAERGRLAGRGRLLWASGGDVRRVPAVPRRAARRRGGPCGPSPRTTRSAPRSGWPPICGSRPWPTRSTAPRLPLGLPLRHPRPLHRRRCARSAGPPPAARTPGPRYPQRRLPRAQRLPRPVRSHRHRYRLRCSSTYGTVRVSLSVVRRLLRRWRTCRGGRVGRRRCGERGQ